MIAWAWFVLCQLFGVLVLFPCGLVVVGLACALRAWTPPTVASIKPLVTRAKVDTWAWRWMRPLWGNPEDGVSGLYAYGPSWTGPFNPTASRWIAFVWAALRNWADGYNYLTWVLAGTPPFLIRSWSLLGRQRQIKLGWQQLPASDGWVGPYPLRMVCSL